MTPKLIPTGGGNKKRSDIGESAKKLRDQLAAQDQADKRAREKARERRNQLEHAIAKAELAERRAETARNRDDERHLASLLGCLALDKLAVQGAEQLLFGSVDLQKLGDNDKVLLDAYLKRRQVKIVDPKKDSGDSTPVDLRLP